MIFAEITSQRTRRIQSPHLSSYSSPQRRRRSNVCKQSTHKIFQVRFKKSEEFFSRQNFFRISDFFRSEQETIVTPTGQKGKVTQGVILNILNIIVIILNIIVIDSCK